MRCSKDEFLAVIGTWSGRVCAVHLHAGEISGALVATFQGTSPEGVLQFSAHALLEPLAIDLSGANEFEFGVPAPRSVRR
jgi:hypothetical protein